MSLSLLLYFVKARSEGYVETHCDNAMSANISGVRLLHSYIDSCVGLINFLVLLVLSAARAQTSLSRRVVSTEHSLIAGTKYGSKYMCYYVASTNNNASAFSSRVLGIFDVPFILWCFLFRRKNNDTYLKQG